MSILASGQNIRDTYEVERMLGEGAFAEVYRVRHRFMGRQALKLFKAFGATLGEIERDLNEATVLSAIKHPNIVEVFDANILEHNGQQHGYFTMTYVPGGTLDRYWRSFGHDLMPTETAVDAVRQACRGLNVAHASDPPIVHRDIKPQNILVSVGSEGLQVRLTDFGLAKSVNPLTMMATARGTLGFKPPESLQNIDSPAADVWALGTTLYLLLTDTLPFPMLGQRDVENASRFLRPIRPPSMYNAQVDPALESVIFRCLAAKPGDRYSNAGELLKDLEIWEQRFTDPVASVSEFHATKSSEFGESATELNRQARVELKEALKIAQDPTKLTLAADLLEEAISKDPNLFERFGGQLRDWRRGIMPVSTADFRDLPRKTRKK